MALKTPAASEKNKNRHFLECVPLQWFPQGTAYIKTDHWGGNLQLTLQLIATRLATKQQERTFLSFLKQIKNEKP